MAQVDYQKLHDVLQALVMAAGHAHTIITADFPEVREKIREYVSDGEYACDPLSALFEAKERAAEIAREMERL